MTRRSVAALVAVLVLVGAGAGSGVSGAAPAGAPADWSGRPTPQRAHPKLSPALDPASRGGLRPAGADSPGNAPGNELVQATGADPNALVAAVQAVGGDVRIVGPSSVVANVATDKVAALSDDAWVDRVIPPQRPRPDATSEGVDNTGPNRVGATNAQAWHDANPTRDGSGVKIGIVDVGFSGYQSAAGLSGVSVTAVNFCGSGTTGFDGSGPNGTDPPISHGTAVAEIVHQMAPGASLVLECVYTDDNMTSAAQDLAERGVKIVNASIGDVLGGRGDGTGGVGSPASAVTIGYQAGELWSVSSGNEAQGHYQFTAFDRDNDGAVESLPGNPVSGPDAQEMFSFTLGAGATADVSMKWDAWPSTSQTFDLCFFQDSSSNEVGCGNVFSFPGPPIQRGIFTNDTGVSRTYFMVIFRHTPSTTITPRIDVYFDGDETNLEAVRADGSVSEPASSPFVMTMGAHCFSNGLSEGFSSQGPTIDGRIKPDLSGPDGVSNDIFAGTIGSACGGHPGFYGTSAGAPHGTGAAALIKQQAPNATSDQIKDLLMQRGVDAGAPGPDNTYGSGRLNMGALAFLKSVTSGPGAVSPFPGRTDVFVKGDDNALWTRSVTATSKSAWVSLGGTITSDPDVAAWGGGRMDVFARGSDNALWHRWTGDGTNWSGWERLGGTLTAGPTAVSWGPNRIDVFVRGTDNGLWTMYWNGASWSSFIPLGGVLVGDPDVASWGPNRLDVFVQGTDNGLWHRWWDGASWQGWEGFGGVLTSGPTAVSWGLNRIDVAVRGTDNAMWWRSWNGVAWSGFSSRGGVLASGPDLGSPGVGRLEAFAKGTDNTIYRQTFNGGTWSGWASIGPP